MTHNTREELKKHCWIDEPKKTLEQPKCEARWGDNPCGHTATKLLPVNGLMFQLCDACYKVTKKQNSLTY